MSEKKNKNNDAWIALGILAAAGGVYLLANANNSGGWSDILGGLGGGVVGGSSGSGDGQTMITPGNTGGSSGGDLLGSSGGSWGDSAVGLPQGSFVSELLTYVNNTPNALVGGYNPDSVFTTGNYVASLHGDPIRSDRIDGNTLGYFTPEKLNQGYGQRTDITALAQGIGSIPVDYSGSGWATYYTKKGSEITSAEVRDQRLYAQNFQAAVSQEVYNNPGKSSSQIAADASKKALAASQAGEQLQAAPRVYEVYYNDGSGVQKGYSYDLYGSQKSIMKEDPRKKASSSSSSGGSSGGSQGNTSRTDGFSGGGGGKKSGVSSSGSWSNGGSYVDVG